MHLFSNLHELATVLWLHLIIYIGFLEKRRIGRNRQDFLSNDNKMLKHGIFFGETLGHIEYFLYICTRLSDKK